MVACVVVFACFWNYTAATECYKYVLTLSLHDALSIFNRPVGSDRLYFGFTITKACQIAESDEAQRVTRRAYFLEYLEPTLQFRTIIVTERAIGCEFHQIGRAHV